MNPNEPSSPSPSNSAVPLKLLLSQNPNNASKVLQMPLPDNQTPIQNNGHNPRNDLRTPGHPKHPEFPGHLPAVNAPFGFHGYPNYNALHCMPPHAFMAPPPLPSPASQQENVNAVSLLASPSSKPTDPTGATQDLHSECKFSLLNTLMGHTKSIAVVKFSPCGTYLGTASADKQIKIWRLSDWKCEKTLLSHTLGVNDISWSTNSRLIASCSDDTTLKLFSVSMGKCLRTMKGHTSYVFCCSFNPQSSLIVSGGYDEFIRVWDVQSGNCMRAIPAHSDPVTSVSFNHDGSKIASSSYDGCIRIWDVSNGACLKTLADADRAPITFVKFTPNGKFILSSQLDSTLKLWDYMKDKPIKHYEGHENTKYCIFAHMNVNHGKRVISGAEDGKIVIWNLQTRKVIQAFEAHKTPVLATDAHPTLNIMASGGLEPDHVVRIWKSDK
ncbi:unnamed protein product [Caenorhabditis brenneri]